MWMLSCLFLSVVVLCCVIGVLFPPYKDNLIQRVGMAILAFGCAARVQHIWRTEHVNNDWFLVHGGMVLIALGTCIKMYFLGRERIEIERTLKILEVALRNARKDIVSTATTTVDWRTALAAIERRYMDLRRAIAHRNDFHS